MRGAEQDARLPTMDDGSDERVDQFRIELHMHGRQPSGRVCAEGTGAREFTGWVGLMSVVDALAASGGSALRDEGRSRGGNEGSS